MNKRSLVLAVALVFVCGMAAGCMAHTHVVGSGGKGNGYGQARQWYALWGLVKINNADSAQMAGNATDYTIKTWVSPIDFLISIFTGYVTIYCRTVEVQR